MTRRKLFGFSLSAFLAADLAWADDGLPKLPTPEEVRKMDAANLPLRQGPTMDMLINLSRDSDYYRKVFAAALRVTGPIAYDQGGKEIEVFQSNFRSLSWWWDGKSAYGRSVAKSVYDVLIPVEILPAIKLEQRGYSFPRGIPFKPIAIEAAFAPIR